MPLGLPYIGDDVRRQAFLTLLCTCFEQPGPLRAGTQLETSERERRLEVGLIANNYANALEQVRAPAASPAATVLVGGATPAFRCAATGHCVCATQGAKAQQLAQQLRQQLQGLQEAQQQQLQGFVQAHERQLEEERERARRLRDEAAELREQAEGAAAELEAQRRRVGELEAERGRLAEARERAEAEAAARGREAEVLRHRLEVTERSAALRLAAGRALARAREAGGGEAAAEPPSGLPEGALVTMNRCGRREVPLRRLDGGLCVVGGGLTAWHGRNAMRTWRRYVVPVGAHFAAMKALAAREAALAGAWPAFLGMRVDVLPTPPPQQQQTEKPSSSTARAAEDQHQVPLRTGGRAGQRSSACLLSLCCCWPRRAGGGGGDGVDVARGV